MKNNAKPDLLDPDHLLLHVCCAPCAGNIIKTIIKEKIRLTVFFYNPNIYPEKEYLIRKKEIINYALKLNVPFVDYDYDPLNWQTYVKGLENELERGKRCDKCFYLRLFQTADYASKNSFLFFATTLGISRWKNLSQVNQAGINAAQKFQNLTFIDRNWRKNGGVEKMYKTAKEQNFYQQKYCGCIYSIRK